jgi:NitT/TauT family transport system ATP-binding protein
MKKRHSEARAAEICVQNVSKSFASLGNELVVIDDVSFRARPNEFVALLGPSGCGKSTILRMVGALESTTSGTLSIGASRPDPGRNRLGFVFQGDSLLPWRTIESNVGLGLEVLGVNATERTERVSELIELVGLRGFESYFPYQLSGGMRQRAAVARAFAIDPEVLLMDEPFGSLDVQIRASLQLQLLELWERLKTTVLFVTHDVDEAVLLADNVIVFTPRPGRIREVVPIKLLRPRDSLSNDFLAAKRRLQSLLT